MSQTIDKPVGERGVNQKSDVQVVCGLLNQIRPHCGGPATPLQEAALGPFHKPLNEAIRRFQKHHFGVSTGRIEPNESTIEALNQVAANAVTCVKPPVAQLMAGYREAVIQVAEKEATRPDRVIGVPKNSKQSRDAKQAARLKEYFTVFPEAKLWTDDSIYMDGKPKGKSWCGIFATWVLSRVFMEEMTFVGGNVNPGIFRDGQLVEKRKDMHYMKGDICLTEAYPGEQWPTHHFIVRETPAPGTSTMQTLEGNFADVKGNYQYHSVTENSRPVTTYGYFAILSPKNL